MEINQIQYIKNNLTKLQSFTRCNGTLLGELTKLGLLVTEEEEEITSFKTQTKQSKRLFEILFTKTGGYSGLKESLSAARQTGAYKILDSLYTEDDNNWKKVQSIDVDLNSPLLSVSPYSGYFKGHMAYREQVAVKRMAIPRGEIKIDEIAILGGLPSHSNIVQFLCAERCIEENEIYVAFEIFVCTLDELRVNENYLNYRESIVEQIVAGVKYLHNNSIAHCDLLPNNIVVAAKSDKVVVAKISNFDKAILVEQENRFIQEPSNSVYRWKSPEVLRSINAGQKLRTSVMVNADIFSLGCLLFYVITDGKHPFGGKVFAIHNIITGRHEIVESDFSHDTMDCSQLIKRMIASNASDRPSCEDILQDLTRIRLKSMADLQSNKN